MCAVAIQEHELSRLYLTENKTDSEIAVVHGVDRTRISQLRKAFGIPTRKYTGYQGVDLAVEELRNRGIKVVNMKETDGTHPFDLLINGKVRVEIKTATVCRYGYFRFIFTEKPSNGNIESNTRIRLPNGRTKKLYRKSCDLLMCMGLSSDGRLLKRFVIPSDLVPDDMQTLAIPLKSADSKYSVYEDRWDFF